MKKIELLAPAGNMEKLKTALYFGADAVYMGGHNFSLRQYSQNFSTKEIYEAAQYAHNLGKKVYVTINIFARDYDFGELREYLKVLEDAKIDAVIVSDLGVMDMVLNNTKLDVHVSTQANTTNSRAIDFYAKLGVKRVILARELSLKEIQEIKRNLKSGIEIEAFVHGAMCISYSGRCLLSNFFTGRDSNRGECVQACRWDYNLTQSTKPGKDLIINEDEKGTYILNSKDLNMLNYLDQLAQAGIDAFKIEGRMKTAYYVATVVNAYRRALDCLYNGQAVPEIILNEPYKTSHREFTTGFYFNNPEQSYSSSRPIQTYDFTAIVKDYNNGRALVEQRNRFEAGDELEILSPSDAFLKTIKINEMYDKDGNLVKVADKVQQELYINTDIELRSGDILRKKQKNS
ncbi:MAG TPA: U32 family peptidase [Clostridia bacterium]|jgi:putative protease